MSKPINVRPLYMDRNLETRLQEDEDTAHRDGKIYVRIDDRSASIQELHDVLTNSRDFSFIGVSAPPDKTVCNAIRIYKDSMLTHPDHDTIYRWVHMGNDSTAKCYINTFTRRLGRQSAFTVPDIILYSHDEVLQRLKDVFKPLFMQQLREPVVKNIRAIQAVGTLRIPNNVKAHLGQYLTGYPTTNTTRKKALNTLKYYGRGGVRKGRKSRKSITRRN